MIYRGSCEELGVSSNVGSRLRKKKKFQISQLDDRNGLVTSYFQERNILFLSEVLGTDCISISQKSKKNVAK